MRRGSKPSRRWRTRTRTPCLHRECTGPRNRQRDAGKGHREPGNGPEARRSPSAAKAAASSTIASISPRIENRAAPHRSAPFASRAKLKGPLDTNLIPGTARRKVLSPSQQPSAFLAMRVGVWITSCAAARCRRVVPASLFVKKPTSSHARPARRIDGTGFDETSVGRTSNRKGRTKCRVPSIRPGRSQGPRPPIQPGRRVRRGLGVGGDGRATAADIQQLTPDGSLAAILEPGQRARVSRGPDSAARAGVPPVVRRSDPARPRT